MAGTILLAMAGIALLAAGGELLVRGSSRLALALGISPLVVGLTVVAFGTSAPELAVSIDAAWTGGPGVELAVGNVVGSNILNVLLILGLSAALAPLAVSQQVVRLEVPLTILASVLMYVFAFDGRVSSVEGAFLAAGAVTYTAFAVWRSRREEREVGKLYDEHFRRGKSGTRATLVHAGQVVAGVALLVAGSRWLVEGAVSVARAVGVSELVVGLTIVAAGTSLPELVTSVMASLKGQRDIAVGNVVGSNLFNILAVLGITSVVAPGGLRVPGAALALDIPVMIVVAVACLPIFFTGCAIARWEGLLFLAYYVVYTTYLVVDATGHAARPWYNAMVLWFALPLTGVTLLVIAARSGRRRRAGSPCP